MTYGYALQVLAIAVSATGPVGPSIGSRRLDRQTASLQDDPAGRGLAQRPSA